MTETSGTPRSPRRAPAPDERKLDAERSRRLLLEAAKEEFAGKGFAGARVQDIADRAGVNKQLINYYFGGKEGLYEELGREWLRREAAFNDPAVPLDELVARYLDETFRDPRGVRLDVWRGLAGERWEQEPEDLSDLRRRQAEGELAEDLDVAAVMLLFFAAVSAPVVLPHAVRRIFGVEPDSPEFRERYTRELRRVVRHLA
ncbi:TetR family transcriptional regulator [Streptomyces sp. B1866]|uniref:TetR family transcriptional regulator n=1 Tax=Streptomyces sp. B1866 TaxID=3075431 RepID=UPI002891A104|nr:TetR family transcriptional regulator [Streptomyces sp. B1866]MDT3396583.1 TetR family transcriptional regulator [Streptomyces sp. B1866]